MKLCLKDKMFSFQVHTSDEVNLDEDKSGNDDNGDSNDSDGTDDGDDIKDDDDDNDDDDDDQVYGSDDSVDNSEGDDDQDSDVTEDDENGGSLEEQLRELLKPSVFKRSKFFEKSVRQMGLPPSNIV